MILIISYLIICLIALIVSLIMTIEGQMPPWITSNGLASYSVLVGGIGGVIYCLRGVYLNRCVRKQWDKVWHTWYVLRPIVSLVMGGISWLILKAGLLVLGMPQSEPQNNFGFLVVAFIAGYNVDKFLSKVEDIASATWGIDKSRSSRLEADGEKKEG